MKLEIINFQPTRELWWVTGFDPYTIDRKPEELTATFTVDFTDRLELLKKFEEKYGDRPQKEGEASLRRIVGTNKIRITF